MKKYLLPVTLAVAATMTANAESKLDTAAKVYVDYYKQLQQTPNALLAVNFEELPFELTPYSRAVPDAAVIITLADDATVEDIEAQGFTIKAKAGNMVVASASLEDVVAISESDLVKVVSFGSKADPMLYNARKMMGMDDIHNGTSGLSTSYKGEGVIAGIYDVGVDANHVNFMNDDLSESRIERLWKFTSTNGANTEYTNETLSSYTPDSKTESHGTHTIGCMAGSHNQTSSSTATYTFYDSDTDKSTTYNRYTKGKNPYYGMAPKASIVAGAGSLYDSNTMVALSNMVDYAKAQNKPLVVSLSIGTTVGSHDEYETFNQYLDQIANDAIVCIAAGNEGTENLSIVKTFTSSDNTINTFVDFSSSATGYFEVYSTDDSKVTVTPYIYNLVTDKIDYEYDVLDANTVIATSEYSTSTYLHPEAFAQAFQKSYLNCQVDKHQLGSKRYSVRIGYSLTYNSTDNPRKTKMLGFKITGTAGQRIFLTKYGDAEFTTNDMAGYDQASPDFTISSMACGKNVIVVGAHNSVDKVFFTSGTGFQNGDESYAQGKVSPFTSYGVLYDGRKLPHVCAPGTNIISSVNSYDTSNYPKSYASAFASFNNRTYYWSYMDGTSMATPILAGALATWVEAYPQLTNAQALQVIQETAIVDDNVLNSGTSCQWGAGRFNAIGGLKKLLGLDGVANIAADKDDTIVTDNGDNVYEAFVPGAAQVNAQIYNISGQVVAKASANGEQVSIDASNLAKGVYVLKLSNNYSQRILVK